MAKKYESHESCDHPCNKAARAKCRRWRKMLRDVIDGDA